jgi:glycerol uptake facilitator-like aquaporin
LPDVHVANPAVTLARCFTDTFAGIRPADAPGFILAQLLAMTLALPLIRRLFFTEAAGASEPAS